MIMSNAVSTHVLFWGKYVEDVTAALSLLPFLYPSVALSVCMCAACGYECLAMGVYV